MKHFLENNWFNSEQRDFYFKKHKNVVGKKNLAQNVLEAKIVKNRLFAYAPIENCN